MRNDEAKIKDDRRVEGDKQTMEIIRSVGNIIHLSIQLGIDCPSNQDDRKMSSLDLKFHVHNVGGIKKIMRELYAKDVLSLSLLLLSFTLYKVGL